MRVVRLGMSFLDAIEFADDLKDMTDACVGDAFSEALLPCKGHAVVRHNGMYAVRERPQAPVEGTVLRWILWPCQRMRHA
jgi:hypothetical protein